MAQQAAERVQRLLEAVVATGSAVRAALAESPFFDVAEFDALATARAALLQACRRAAARGGADVLLHARAVALSAVPAYHAHFQSFQVEFRDGGLPAWDDPQVCTCLVVCLSVFALCLCLFAVVCCVCVGVWRGLMISVVAAARRSSPRCCRRPERCGRLLDCWKPAPRWRTFHSLSR